MTCVYVCYSAFYYLYNVEVTTKRCRLFIFLTEIDLFPLFWQYVLEQETVVLEISCDLNNTHLHKILFAFECWYLRYYH